MDVGEKKKLKIITYVITVRRDIQREHIDIKNKYTRSINGVA